MNKFVVMLVDAATLRNWRAEGMREEYRYNAANRIPAVDSTLAYPRQSVPYFFEERPVAEAFAEELSARHPGTEVGIFETQMVFTAPPGAVKKIMYTKEGAFPE